MARLLLAICAILSVGSLCPKSTAAPPEINVDPQLLDLSHDYQSGLWKNTAAPQEMNVEEQLLGLSREYNLFVCTIPSSLEPSAFDLTGSLSLQHDPSDIMASNPTAEQLKASLPVLLSEWKLYPPQVMAKANVGMIVLGRQIKEGPMAVGGLAVPWDDRLYLVVDASPEFLRRGIHHELFHMIDYAITGYVDPEWESLNPPDFKYPGQGAPSTLGEGGQEIDPALPSFLTPYSMTTAEEDKAETFANLVVNGLAVERRAAEDPVIRAKVRLTKDRLRSFCPELDDSFWEHMRQVHQQSDSPRAPMQSIAPSATPTANRRGGWVPGSTSIVAGSVVAAAILAFAWRRRQAGV
jgi:hypothetical protein